jgi:hypothetical protein
MKVLGMLSAVALGAVALLASLGTLRSLPDIKRYLKIRSM